MTVRRKVTVALAVALALVLVCDMLLAAHRRSRVDRLLKMLLYGDEAAAKTELVKTRDAESLRYLATYLFYKETFERPRSGLVSLSAPGDMGRAVADVLAEIGEPAVDPACDAAESALSTVPSGWRRLRIEMASWSCLPESFRRALRPRAQYARMGHVAHTVKGIGAPAAPRLIEMLRSGEPMRYTLAVHCLSRIDSPAATDAVLSELDSPDAAVRRAAASAVAMDKRNMEPEDFVVTFWLPRIDMPRPAIIVAGLESPDRAVKEELVNLISGHAMDYHNSVGTYAGVKPIKDPRVYEILVALSLNPLESAETRRRAELARIRLYEDPSFEPRIESTDV